jgi:hypothetical protein
VKPVQFPVNVKVSGQGGTYTTQTVAGLRASSTSSAETAVGRLVDKLTAALKLQPGELTARDLHAKGQRPTCSVWQIDVNRGGA